MNFDNRAIIIGVNLRDLQTPMSGRHIFVDVVLIDKSNEILQPLLYQLKNEAMHSERELEQFRRNGYMSLDHNAFAMIGEVLTIDKKKKQIYLKNEDTVTYKHLITASGLSPTQIGSIHDEELTAGFHTLTEALRINKNTENLRNGTLSEHFQFAKHKQHSLRPQKPAEEVTIQSLIKKLSIYDSSKSLDMTLAGTNRRLYEVQL